MTRINNKIKIGIVFFDELHIIPHFVGAVAELYKDPDCEVDILTYKKENEYLFSVLEKLEIPSTVVKKLSTYFYKKIAYKLKGRTKPSNSYIIKKHKNKFASYDVLVFNVLNHVNFKRESREKQKFVMLMHGAGDRDYPFLDIYKDAISKFDLVTTAGQKINDLFEGMGVFEHTKFEICGYQKLDVIEQTNNKRHFFSNDKPTVLYIPHFVDDITSFHKFGEEVLNFFLNNKKYNLIFVPHYNLFNRGEKKDLKISIDTKYLKVNNIHVDLGSINSIDMTYTSIADIYLGDVSSQVYEFLIKKPKPCIFINAHNVNWETNKYYQNWKLGKVINNLDNFEEILNTRELWQKEFESVQKKAIAYTFDISKEQSSSQRVARAIKKLIIK